MPCVFGYLPDKKYDTYTTFFSLLKSSLASYELELSATSLMTDFEINWRKAVLDVFNGILLIGEGNKFLFKQKLS